MLTHFGKVGPASRRLWERLYLRVGAGELRTFLGKKNVANTRPRLFTRITFLSAAVASLGACAQGKKQIHTEPGVVSTLIPAGSTTATILLYFHRSQ